MNYAALAQTVNAKLAAYGQQITVKRYTPSRNSSTGAVTKGAATLTASCAAIEVPVTQGLVQSFETRLDEAALTTKVMRAFKVSTLLGFKPLPLDEVTLNDGSVWPVVGCTPVNPAGIPLVYTIGVAK
jgi:hypothetical protein